MLFTSSDEEVGALLEHYKNLSEKLERNLLMMHLKSDGHLSLQDVYNMPYKMRELYIKINNEFIEKQQNKNNS